MQLALCLFLATIICALTFYLAYSAGYSDGEYNCHKRNAALRVRFYQLGFKHGVSFSKRKRDARGRYIKQ